MAEATNNPKLRRQVWPTRGEKEQAGDIQQGFDRAPLVLLRTVEEYYKEPFVIGQLTREPAMVEAGRIVSLVAPEQAVIHSLACSYVWKPQLGGIQILSVNGLTPSTSIKYRFTFRLTFEAL